MTGANLVHTFLRSHGWLSAVEARFRDAVLLAGVARTFAQGAAIYREGDLPNGLYGLVHGAVAVEVAPNERGPHCSNLLRAGCWFGEMEIFARRPRASTLTALTSSTCLHVPLAAIERLTLEYNDAWQWIGLLCAQHMEHSIACIDDLMIRETERRVAAVILRLADARSRDNPCEAEPIIHASQEEIALMSNLGRAAISICLGEFQAAGLIERGYKRLRILDQKGLRGRIAPAPA